MEAETTFHGSACERHVWYGSQLHEVILAYGNPYVDFCRVRVGFLGQPGISVVLRCILVFEGHVCHPDYASLTVLHDAGSENSSSNAACSLYGASHPLQSSPSLRNSGYPSTSNPYQIHHLNLFGPPPPVQAPPNSAYPVVPTAKNTSSVTTCALKIKDEFQLTPGGLLPCKGSCSVSCNASFSHGALVWGQCVWMHQVMQLAINSRLGCLANLTCLAA